MRLLGVHRTMSHKGKTSSLAFTDTWRTLLDGDYNPPSSDGSPISLTTDLKTRFEEFCWGLPCSNGCLLIRKIRSTR